MHGITQQMRCWWRGGSPSSGSDARPDGCDTKCPHTAPNGTQHPCRGNSTEKPETRHKAPSSSSWGRGAAGSHRACSLKDNVGSVCGRLSRTTAPLQKLSSVYQQCQHLGAPPAQPVPALALPPARVRLPQARPQPAPAPLSLRQANDTGFGVRATVLPLLWQKSGPDQVPSLSRRGTSHHKNARRV